MSAAHGWMVALAAAAGLLAVAVNGGSHAIHPNAAKPPPPRPLSDAELDLYSAGRGWFVTCVGCHGADGRGVKGLGEPLAGSPLVLGRADRVALVLMHGLHAPTGTDGPNRAMMAPAQFCEDDEAVAGVLTYIRRSWGNAADPVTPGDVARVRSMHLDRDLPWTREELANLPLPEGTGPNASSGR